MWHWEKLYSQQATDLLEYGKLVYGRGLVSASGGNVSVRCGNNMLITASNDSLRNISRQRLLFCDFEGNVLEGDSQCKPSKEAKFHSAIYKSRPAVNSVIHAHPCYATIFSLSGEQLPLYTDSAKLKLKSVPLIPQAQPGSKELAEHVEQAVSIDAPEAVAYLLEAHGILTLGATMKESFDLTELLEDTAKIAVFKSLMG